MSNVYVISDLHLGHKNILNFRQDFDSVEEHDKTIVENICTITSKRDTLWVLGDMLFDESRYDLIKTISDNVGYLNLVLGNHCTDSRKRRILVERMISDGLVQQLHGLVSYKKCWLSHAPIHESELRGRFNVYGHTHNCKVDDSRYFPVSCEHLNYTPILFTDILEILMENNK